MRFSVKFIVFLILLTGFSGTANVRAQKAAYVENVRMIVRSGKVFVTYDLVDEDEERGHDIDLKFISDRHQLISPRSLRGDIGPSVTSGRDKTIIWDISQDVNTLPGRMSPRIFLDFNPYSSKYKGGPENAWYSLLMPGLGDYKVADPAHLKIPPYVRTAVSWGFIGTGIVAAINRYEGEGHYETYIPQYGWYGQDLPYDPDLKRRYVEGPTQYWLFRGDAEVFIAAGLAVWIYDILWVSSKGQGNQRLMKSLENQNLSLVSLPRGIGLCYRFDF